MRYLGREGGRSMRNGGVGIAGGMTRKICSDEGGREGGREGGWADVKERICEERRAGGWERGLTR